MEPANKAAAKTAAVEDKTATKPAAKKAKKAPVAEPSNSTKETKVNVSCEPTKDVATNIITDKVEIVSDNEGRSSDISKQTNNKVWLTLFIRIRWCFPLKSLEDLRTPPPYDKKKLKIRGRDGVIDFRLCLLL